jgi:hypothetical protein
VLGCVLLSLSGPLALPALPVTVCWGAFKAARSSLLRLSPLILQHCQPQQSAFPSSHHPPSAKNLNYPSINFIKPLHAISQKQSHQAALNLCSRCRFFLIPSLPSMSLQSLRDALLDAKTSEIKYVVSRTPF